MMKSTIVLVIAVGFLTNSFTKELPRDSTMTYIKYRYEGKELTGFDLFPREVWRVGKEEMTMLESPDSVGSIHGLMTYNPPDFWMINLFDSSGIHGVDPGPSFNSKAPVFAYSKPDTTNDFELGFEMAYIEKNNLKPVGDTTINRIKCKYYIFKVAGGKITLLVNKSTGFPLRASLESSELNYEIVYEIYQTNLKVDSLLFLPPAKVVIREAK